MGELTDARILIVDDEVANVRLLERLLEHAEYRNIRTTTDARTVRTLYEEFQPDLILLDLMMPQFDGIAVMGQLAIPEHVYLPILVLTADAGAEAKQRALSAGAKDFLTKPFDRLEVLLRIKNLLHTRQLYVELERHNRSLEQIVTERTQRLLQTEKLATMGSLLAGVAHELNNPLAVIVGQAQLLREKATDAGLTPRAEKIKTAAERCARIVRNFLALARHHSPERGEVRLNQVIRDALEILAYELRTDSVEVKFAPDEELPPLWADAHQLHQVLVNLVTNAHHAIRRLPPPRCISLATRLDRARGRVELRISDTGPGIPADIREKVFEPFFTTKPAGEGTGLGLSLSRGIVEDHGGTIALDGDPGGGTTFVIELPLTERPSPATQGPPVESLPPVQGKHVLVVDDEVEVAQILREILEQAGHHADTVSDGAVALEHIAQRHYDLVLSDTKMPALDGISLYRELERRSSALCRRFVFLTGDVLNREKREFLESSGVPCLTKPFDVPEVRRLVHRMLTSDADAKAR